jgi:phenylpropionate dioxygenase-like ring-hydroxylating dioxygenase large terminal subunit
MPISTKGNAMNVAVPIKQSSRQRSKGLVRLEDLLRDHPDVDPLPEGWFVIEFSARVKADKLISRKWLGEEVVIFRHPSGEVIVSQAYCPHMGGHFDAYGKGGCVENGVITCPYHHLRFDPARERANAAAGFGAKLRVYPTFEAHGFVFAMRKRDPDGPDLPQPDLSFEVEDESEYRFGTETFGVFEGDSLVPLIANADFEHFRTVHGFAFSQSSQRLQIAEDGQSCSWTFEQRDRASHETALKPIMHDVFGNMRRRAWRKEIAREGAEPAIINRVKSYGNGPGVLKSDWYEERWGLHLLSLLYITPIDAFTYEVFANCGVRTIKRHRNRMVQRILNRLGMYLHLWANVKVGKYDDLPFYTSGKIRLAKPGYVQHDILVKGFGDWWKREFFSDEYLALIGDRDLDFRKDGPRPKLRGARWLRTHRGD